MPLSYFIRQLKERRNDFNYKRKYHELKREIESLQAIVSIRVPQIENDFLERLSVLETRVKELEEHQRSTDGVIRIIESIKPEKRQN